MLDWTSLVEIDTCQCITSKFRPAEVAYCSYKPLGNEIKINLPPVISIDVAKIVPLTPKGFEVLWDGRGEPSAEHNNISSSY